MNGGLKRGQDSLFIGQTPLTQAAGRQRALLRFDDDGSACAQSSDMLHDGGMVPHVPVHGRREDHRTVGREEHGGEEVVCESEGGFGQAIGGGRRNDDGLRLFREREVKHLLVRFKEVGRHMRAGQDFKCQRGDEPAGSGRHHHVDRRGFAPEQAQQTHGFISRNTPRDGEHKTDTGK